VTGVFGAAQAYIAAEAGARFVIPYFNRTTRLAGSGAALVAEIAGVLRDGFCEILAASIKSPAEAVDALLAGAHHLTVPWQVLTGMANHRLTELALDEFADAARSSPAHE
jgi:transaldolase